MNIFGVLQDGKVLGLPLSRVAILMACSLMMAGSEVVALVLMVPIFQYIQADGDLAQLTADSQVWQTLASVHDAVGLTLGLASLLAMSFAFVLFRQVANFSYNMVMARARTALAYSIRTQLFSGFLGIPLADQERSSSGAIINTFTTMTDGASTALFQFVHLITLTILFVIYGALMFSFAWQMTLATVLMIIVAGFALRGYVKRSRSAGKASRQAAADLSAFLGERLRLLRLVKLSHMEEAEQTAMRRLTDAQRRHMVKVELINARLGLLVEPLIIAVAFSFLYLGYAYFGLRLEQLGLFLLVLLRLTPVGRDFLMSRQRFTAYRPMLEQVTETLKDWQRQKEPSAGSMRFTRLAEGIRYRQVTFSYDADNNLPALQGVDLDIPARSFLALVGPSGSGKSTLVDLLPRLRLPTSGSITIDGHDLGAFDLTSLREHIAYLPQSAQVFDVTVTEHLRYGKPDATEDDIHEALEMAGAADFVRQMPQGIHSRLGENGVALSGGQRQRLDLARTLIKKAPIVILDEPTAALDAEAEDAFRQSLIRLRDRRISTVLLIGHRLSTVVMADRIAVLQKGRVVETGTHNELLASRGWYARAWAIQHPDDVTVSATASDSTS